MSNRTHVLILQHPDEFRHPLNTARLAVLGLQNAQIWVGEAFPQLELALASAGQACLLFPSNENELSQPLAQGDQRKPRLLVVPDGTWRKAQKIVRASPVLESLPRLSLPISTPSEYRVRKAREPLAVSTIEAIVRALSMLEPEQDFQSLLRPFNVLVEQQIEAMGAEVYRRNYAR